MRNHLSVTLLSLVLVALLADIFIRAHPVQAQANKAMYVDQIASIAAPYEPVKMRGTNFVAFSCSGGNCYVLSK